VDASDVKSASACRVYVRMGCELCAIRRDAYSILPEETHLLWAKGL